MKLLSVNVSQPKEVLHNGKRIKTGIFKEPVSGRTMMRRLNLDGDGQGDPTVHGGIHKAVYVYPIEHYRYWKQELGRDDLTYGKFGENLTVEGMLEDTVHIGDVFRVGEALVEVSQPRVPCFKLGIKMRDPQIVKPFLQSERVGFYVRVLEEGEVGAGDAIERTKVGEGQMTVKEIVHLRHFDNANATAAEKAANLSALTPSWRDSFEEILVKAQEGSRR
ncbi:MOSC domain-containing protein [Candidatus Poribacteria bacterium]|nr:MAG: MOSC domain-containing protein [Candidatus Poribacteria bacterium]